MAEDKKGFILYADQQGLFEKLPNEKAGELIKHIFKYINDEHPETDDLVISISFEPIEQQFKRDLRKWEKTREGRSKAGKASAEARKNKKEQRLTDLTSVENVQQTLTNPTVSVNATVNATVNVNDNVKEIKKEIVKIFNFKNSLIKYGFKINLVDDWLKVRKTKRATNTETAYNLFIKEIEKRENDINETLEICISKSWQGFQWKWMDNLNKNFNTNQNEPKRTFEQKGQTFIDKFKD